MDTQFAVTEETLAKFSGVSSDAPDRAAQFLKSLAHRDRLKVLCSLVVTQELSVAQIEAAVGASQSAVSQHLARLKDEGLVSARRSGRHVYYAISDPMVMSLIGLLYQRFCAEEADA